MICSRAELRGPPELLRVFGLWALYCKSRALALLFIIHRNDLCASALSASHSFSYGLHRTVFPIWLLPAFLFTGTILMS
jgi:hypothetical protein